MSLPEARDFLAESEALHAAVAGLAPSDFDRPTQFKGWTIGDVLVHLHFWNLAADLSASDPAAFDAFASYADLERAPEAVLVESDMAMVEL